MGEVSAKPVNRVNLIICGDPQYNYSELIN